MSLRSPCTALDDCLADEAAVRRLDDARGAASGDAAAEVARYGLREAGRVCAVVGVRAAATEDGRSIHLDLPGPRDAPARRLVGALLTAARRAGVHAAHALCAPDDAEGRRFWQTLGFMPDAPGADGREPHQRRLAPLPANRPVRALPDDVLDAPFTGQRATLLFVVQHGRVLLIHKKRGHGAGLINGPGGKCEPGESPRACAIREVREELRIEVAQPQWRGELRFLDSSGSRIHGFVYTAATFEGTPTETDEARPQWFDVDGVPFERMWADDRLWLPWVLAGHGIHAAFLTDAEAVVAGRFRLGARPEPAR